ncbi:hypothetical protein TWF481_002748 [Arthrobotrys musiformis]
MPDFTYVKNYLFNPNEWEVLAIDSRWTAENGHVSYTLIYKDGHTRIVEADDILDYVEPQILEDFENDLFAREENPETWYFPELNFPGGAFAGGTSITSGVTSGRGKGKKAENPLDNFPTSQILAIDNEVSDGGPENICNAKQPTRAAIKKRRAHISPPKIQQTSNNVRTVRSTDISPAPPSYRHPPAAGQPPQADLGCPEKRRRIQFGLDGPEGDSLANRYPTKTLENPAKQKHSPPAEKLENDKKIPSNGITGANSEITFKKSRHCHIEPHNPNPNKPIICVRPENKRNEKARDSGTGLVQSEHDSRLGEGNISTLLQDDRLRLTLERPGGLVYIGRVWNICPPSCKINER